MSTYPLNTDPQNERVFINTFILYLIIPSGTSHRSSHHYISLKTKVATETDAIFSLECFPVFIYIITEYLPSISQITVTLNHLYYPTSPPEWSQINNDLIY